MPATDNNRIYFAVQQVGIKADGSNHTYAAGDAIHGLQSVGISTNFNLEQVFELGQLAIYENIEEIPDIEVTLSKVLDGYPLMFHKATLAATTPTLAGRSSSKSMLALAIFPDTNESAVDNPTSIVSCSGMFVSSLGYSFSIDDNSTEDMTLVGNDKAWLNTSGYGTAITTLPDITFVGAFTDNLDSPLGSGGVNRRQDLDFTAAPTGGLDINGMVSDENATILPPEVFGISDSGVNEKSTASSNNFDAHITRISITADLNREQINELGRKGPYFRAVTFPIEVSCEIEVTSVSGDMITATEGGLYTTNPAACNDEGNLQDRTIRIATCEGTRIYLGTKNKLSSVNYTGGDAGGGNVSVTYAFSTFNDLTVLHSGDPHASGTVWWDDRQTYLVDF